MQIRSVADDPKIKQATGLLADLQKQKDDTRRAHASAEPESDNLKDSVSALLERRDPGRIETGAARDSREQLGLRIVALGRAIEQQKKIVADATATVKGEILSDPALKIEHLRLLQSVSDSAKTFGTACNQLEAFYAQLESAGVGGSSLGHYSWTLHPGDVANRNSRLTDWLRKVRAEGYQVKA